MASCASWRSRGASSRIPAKVARPFTPSGAERSSSKNGTRGRRPSLPRRPYTNASDALEKLRHLRAAGGGVGVVGGGENGGGGGGGGDDNGGGGDAPLDIQIK